MKTGWRSEAETLNHRLRKSVRVWFDHPVEAFPYLAPATRQAYLLFADQLASARQTGRPLLVGVGGGQGAGKSTLVQFVTRLLLEQYDLKVEGFSLDDFYLTRAERSKLSSKVHPMLTVRGVPGTHDISCLNDVLDQLMSGGSPIIPQFDKAIDDRALLGRQAKPLPDFIILEGWCVGARPQGDDELVTPINHLELESDADGAWRTWVNQRLMTDYQTLFGRLDHLAFIQVPGLLSVSKWRYQQERQSGGYLKSRADIDRFIQYYERITRSMLKVLPDQADLVIRLSADHDVKDFYRNAS